MAMGRSFQVQLMVFQKIFLKTSCFVIKNDMKAVNI